jgi:hypothetical protein
MDIVTRNITPPTNTERRINWRIKYEQMTADVDGWLAAIGHAAKARTAPRKAMLALPPPAKQAKRNVNSISAYLRGGILLLAMAVPALSMAADGKVEGCQTIAALAGLGAEARDLGVPQSEFFRALVLKLNDPEQKELASMREDIIAIATVAYALPTESQADIERSTYQWCMGGDK